MSQLCLRHKRLCIKKDGNWGSSSPSQLRRKNVCGWEVSWWHHEREKGASLQQMRRWQRVWLVIRPMFAEGFRNEVQKWSTTVLSYDNAAPIAYVWFILGTLSQIFPTDQSLGYKWAVDDPNHHQPTPNKQSNRFMNRQLQELNTLLTWLRSGAKELSEEIMFEALLKDTSR